MPLGREPFDGHSYPPDQTTRPEQRAALPCQKRTEAGGLEISKKWLKSFVDQIIMPRNRILRVIYAHILGQKPPTKISPLFLLFLSSRYLRLLFPSNQEHTIVVGKRLWRTIDCQTPFSKQGGGSCQPFFHYSCGQSKVFMM